MAENTSKQQASIGIIGIGMVGGALQRYFQEQGVSPAIFDTGKNLGSSAEINQADIIFICVPTPYDKEKGFDLSYVDSAISNIQGNKIVVIKSTLLPGSTETLQEKYSQHKILNNPEFLTETIADQDMCHPGRQILGYTKQSKDSTKDVMAILPLAPYKNILPATEAEMVKYFGNTFFSVKVCFANQMYDLCEKMGIEYNRVMETAAADKWIGRMHLETPHKGYRGFGGKCLLKDNNSLIQFADSKGVDLELNKTAKKLNEQLMKQQNIDDPEKLGLRE
jgi:UDPglucose 6-dehydrogenase